MKGAQAINDLKTSLRMVEGIVGVKMSPSDSVVEVEFDSRTVGVRHVLKNIEVYLYMCDQISGQNTRIQTIDLTHFL